MKLKSDPVKLSNDTAILVTGGDGFLGQYVIRALWQQGFTSIRSISRSEKAILLTPDQQEAVQWIHADIADIGATEDNMKDIGIVIHLAEPSPWVTPGNKVNQKQCAEATDVLVNTALEAGVDKFIHVSAAASMGLHKEGELIREDAVFAHSKYDSPFGLLKFSGEQSVWRGHAEGLPVTVLNPSYVLGAGSWNRSTPRLWSWLRSSPFFCPSGSTGWVDVRDVADAVVRVVREDHVGQRFLISAENLSYRWVCDKAALLAGIRRPPFSLSLQAATLLRPLYALMDTIVRETLFDPYFLGKSIYTQVTYDAAASADALSIHYRSITSCLEEISQKFVEYTGDPNNPGTLLNP